jgi:hypothetical protein
MGGRRRRNLMGSRNLVLESNRRMIPIYGLVMSPEFDCNLLRFRGAPR